MSFSTFFYSKITNRFESVELRSNCIFVDFFTFRVFIVLTLSFLDTILKKIYLSYLFLKTLGSLLDVFASSRKKILLVLHHIVNYSL